MWPGGFWGRVRKVAWWLMEIKLWPHKPGDGGILMLPTVRNVTAPRHPDWRMVKCPKCGGDCWEGDGHREIIRAEGVVAWCTECALREGRKNDGPVRAGP